MSDAQRILISPEPSVTPDEVASRTFATSFRGYNPDEVRSFLRSIGDELAAVQDRARELQRRLDEAEQKESEPPELDEATLTARLGDETARVLRNARQAATEITDRAQQDVSRMVREAEAERARLRTEAERALARRSQQIHEEAEAIQAQARSDADAELEAARAQGREMVAEAQAVRERVLADLIRRRRLVQGQINQLRAGRERLLEAYRLVRRTLDEVTEELTVAEDEARKVAVAAGQKETDAEADASQAATGAAVLDELVAIEAASDEAATESTTDDVAATDKLKTELDPQPEATVDPLSSALGDRRLARLPVEAANGATDRRRRPGFRRSRQPQAEAVGESVELSTSTPATAAGVEPTEAGSDHDRSSPASRRQDDVSSSDAVSAPDGARPDAGDQPAVVPSDDEAVGKPGDGRPDSKPHNDQPGGKSDIDDIVAAAAVDVEEATLAEDRGAAGDVDGTAEPMPMSGGENSDVEAVFARLRADRAAAVAKARAVLGGGDDGDVGDDEAVVAELFEKIEGFEGAGLGGGVGDKDALRRRDDALEMVETTLARKLKRVLQNEQNAVLDALRTHQGELELDAILPSVTEQIRGYQSVALPLLEQARHLGATFVGGKVTVGASVDDLVDDLVEALVSPLREQVVRSLGNAVAGNGVADAVGAMEQVGASYRELKVRLRQLARDHTGAAFNRGVFAAVPRGATLRWVVDDEGGLCPDCDDNALAGPTRKGQAFPTGQKHPPAHSGCRCLVIPT